jgi:hypothetical protein
MSPDERTTVVPIVEAEVIAREKKKIDRCIFQSGISILVVI